MSFGKNLGFYRKQLNITQEELAEKLFVTRQTVSRWETDSVFPDVETIIKLCDMFNCSMDTLVRGDAEKETVCSEKSSESEEGNNESSDGNEGGSYIDWYYLNGSVCSVIMLVSLMIFLLLGILGGLWHPGWIVFIIGAVACAISSVSGEIINSIFFRK